MSTVTIPDTQTEMSASLDIPFYAIIHLDLAQAWNWLHSLWLLLNPNLPAPWGYVSR